MNQTSQILSRQSPRIPGLRKRLKVEFKKGEGAPLEAGSPVVTDA